MRRTLVLISLLLACTPAGATGNPVLREGAAHSVPLHGSLIRPYDAPTNPYAPGHRGVDVAAPAGSPVRASAPGVVSFAGNVAGNLSVTVDHGDGVRTTYSYLSTIAAAAGRAVDRGDVVGATGSGHPGSGLGPHVHLAARRDGLYFDPLMLYVGSSHADLVSIVR
ncbi:MAG TPA: M23 family metallopeptidase [Actinomycetota bacterium]|nr:M23 family metallopeptidase [Actinomycetota bacterium]